MFIRRNKSNVEVNINLHLFQNTQKNLVRDEWKEMKFIWKKYYPEWNPRFSSRDFFVLLFSEIQLPVIDSLLSFKKISGFISVKKLKQIVISI